MQSRRANARDDEAVRALLAAVGDELARQGYLNWMPAWSLERVRTVLASRDVYVVHDDAELVASYILGPTPVTPYTTPPWPAPRLTALYLNRLAVAPTLQRRGVGSWCLDDIDERGRAAGARAIRCDVLETNAALNAFLPATRLRAARPTVPFGLFVHLLRETDRRDGLARLVHVVVIRALARPQSLPH